MATRKKTEQFVRVELLEKCQQEKENLHKIIEKMQREELKLKHKLATAKDTERNLIVRLNRSKEARDELSKSLGESRLDNAQLRTENKMLVKRVADKDSHLYELTSHCRSATFAAASTGAALENLTDLIQESGLLLKEKDK